MPILHQLLEIETATGIGIYNITPQVQAVLSQTKIQNGHVLIFSRHTTTALAINEDEPRLLKDIESYLRKLAPETEPYLHNDLHLRPNIPEDEPMNAHAHLMAITLSSSELVPVVAGRLALGTYQSILLFELDGPRQRTVFCQVSGE
ncbi:MAG: YjbQ family protein [Synechococcales cyanobacterium C42_A2020_086]|jgi:secondary thiamine-phosphate synthase enzyme|nr:YjbQ family protein [Synechococcales cyanobacterium M58_A2018_015]MBF2076095.1 YjbQ family protein [Synechococcales cyanobacterium C42_A2020_086]